MHLYRHDIDRNVVADMLKYAEYVVNRGWVCNTLGTVAARVTHPKYGYVIYTKRKGISLEEMGCDDIAITDGTGNLLHGKGTPSIGHQLNREVLLHRSDINAVIHLHVREIIALFTVLGNQTRLNADAFPLEFCKPSHSSETFKRLRFISDDAPLVHRRYIYVLEKEINVEADASMVKDFVQYTNCFVMPNHGITSFGKDISEAYYRLHTAVEEVGRIISAIQVAANLKVLTGKKMKIPYVSEKDVKQMFKIGRELIYGKK